MKIYEWKGYNLDMKEKKKGIERGGSNRVRYAVLVVLMLVVLWVAGGVVVSYRADNGVEMSSSEITQASIFYWGTDLLEFGHAM